MEKEKAAAEKLAGSEAALENVKGSVEFKTEEEARAALLQAEDSKKQAEEVYQKVLSSALFPLLLYKKFFDLPHTSSVPESPAGNG